MTLSNEYFKPCPFCGSTVALQWTTCWVVDCPKCGYVRQFGACLDYNTAIREWNTRVIPQPAQTESVKYFVNEAGRLEFEKQNFVPAEAVQVEPRHMTPEEKTAMSAALKRSVTFIDEHPAKKPADEQPVAEKTKTPKELWPALRQYRHNYGSEEFVVGFDYDYIMKLFAERPPAPDVLGIVEETRITELIGLKARLKSGNYDGADIMAAWIAIDELTERLRAIVKEKTK